MKQVVKWSIATVMMLVTLSASGCQTEATPTAAPAQEPEVLSTRAATPAIPIDAPTLAMTLLSTRSSEPKAAVEIVRPAAEVSGEEEIGAVDSPAPDSENRAVVIVAPAVVAAQDEQPPPTSTSLPPTAIVSSSETPVEGIGAVIVEAGENRPAAQAGTGLPTNQPGSSNGAAVIIAPQTPTSAAAAAGSADGALTETPPAIVADAVVVADRTPAVDSTPLPTSFPLVVASPRALPVLAGALGAEPMTVGRSTPQVLIVTPVPSESDRSSKGQPDVFGQTMTFDLPQSLITADKTTELHTGPSQDSAIVRSIPGGTALELVGLHAAGEWYLLADGSWIARGRVRNPPEELRLVIPTVTPTPTPTFTATPTETPVPPTEEPPTSTPAPTSLDVEICTCSSDQYECLATYFKTQAEAQACFEYCFRQRSQDIHSLDPNLNGRACENLP